MTAPVQWGVRWPGRNQPENFGADEHRARRVAKDLGGQLMRKDLPRKWAAITELSIPADAMDALEDLVMDAEKNGLYEGDRESYARWIASPVVAAELRRLAHDVFIPAGSDGEAAVLLGRADELDGGAR